EYQILRNVSVAVLREIGVDTGGSNVQVAINPVDGRMVVIEMNPRVSRSSALASKATGFPIAKVAAKLAVGYTLDELKNEITGGATPASFEPTIDYVVTKVPRFTFEKFPQADDRLTTQMKSVGEVMAIGRTFQESLQKALRGLEIGVDGLDEIVDFNESDASDRMQREMRHPGPERLWYVADAFRSGMSFDDVHEASKIDPWFLAQVEDLVLTEKSLATKTLATIKTAELFRLKQKGFSDARLAKLLDSKESDVRKARHKQNIRPVYKRIDSCAAEFSSDTAYLYSTYEQQCEARVTDKEKIIILGGGPNRIGQGIEFDYCCVHAALALREEGYETIMVNCNPETVSTDFDTSDRLYFESLTLEDVLEIIHLENPVGVIVQYGGQTPLKLARELEASGAPIIGTSPDAIDLAEDRERFQKLLVKLDLKQPPNGTASSIEQALNVAKELGFPLVVRPSYVLGGRGMEIVYNEEALQRYMKEAISVSNDSPVLLDRFLDDAIEMDVDAIYDGETLLIGGLMQHVEQAGVHSGDSACSIPPYDLAPHLQDELRVQVAQMAEALGVRGLMNTQFAIQGETIYVLEVNPRASRTAPFVSKATGYPLAKIAALCMAGKSLIEQGITEERIPGYFSVKEAVFPFVKFPGVDPLLGPEMKSTGEVMGVGKTFGEAFAKSQRASGVDLSRSGKVLISIREADKPKIVEIAQMLIAKNYAIVATRGTAKVLESAGIACEVVYKVNEGRPNTVDMIKNDQIQLIFNTTEGVKAVADSFTMRREALQHHVTYYTTMAGAKAACYALGELDAGDVNCLQDLHKEFH
ncbi:MAG: carbamoyl-phosphate synthase large subunit, partial [Gammaproteobacteria bacterium]|nr:carbamoyl-phosphate synthase large subunit [Gammaproteobacteria bacterium]